MYLETLKYISTYPKMPYKIFERIGAKHYDDIVINLDYDKDSNTFYFCYNVYEDSGEVNSYFFSLEEILEYYDYPAIHTTLDKYIKNFKDDDSIYTSYEIVDILKNIKKEIYKTF